MYDKLHAIDPRFLMSKEKSSPVRVYVEVKSNMVTADFSQEEKRMPHSSTYFVGVNLSEGELQLTGELFVQAVRRALKSEVFRGDKVLLVMEGVASNTRGLKQIGYAQKLSELELTDRWRTAEGCGGVDSNRPANQQH